MLQIECLMIITKFEGLFFHVQLIWKSLESHVYLQH